MQHYFFRQNDGTTKQRVQTVLWTLLMLNYSSALLGGCNTAVCIRPTLQTTADKSRGLVLRNQSLSIYQIYRAG